MSINGLPEGTSNTVPCQERRPQSGEEEIQIRNQSRQCVLKYTACDMSGTTLSSTRTTMIVVHE